MLFNNIIIINVEKVKLNKSKASLFNMNSKHEPAKGQSGTMRGCRYRSIVVTQKGHATMLFLRLYNAQR